jgi:hypothetical protein
MNEDHAKSVPGPYPAAVLRLFRRGIRPAIVAALRAMPSPEKCGCLGRKQWLIRQIETI